MSCLTELINLVDVHTKTKAYLPMDVIETNYISMLGGKDEAQKYVPTLTKQWLRVRVRKSFIVQFSKGKVQQYEYNSTKGLLVTSTTPWELNY